MAHQLPPDDPLAALLAATSAPLRQTPPARGPQASTMRLRLDLLLLGVVVVAVGVVLAIAATQDPRPARTGHATATPGASQPTATTDGTMTLEQARSRMDQARQLLAAGRFDDASAQVDPITGDIADQLGASGLRDEIAQAQSNWESNVQIAREDIADRDFVGAEGALATATKLAPLPTDLQVQLDAIHRKARQQQLLGRAEDALAAGNRDLARALATEGWERWHTTAFQDLLDRIGGDPATSPGAADAADAAPDSAGHHTQATAGSGSSSGSTAASSTPAGGTSSSSQHHHASSPGGSSLSGGAGTGSGSAASTVAGMDVSDANGDGILDL